MARSTSSVSAPATLTSKQISVLAGALLVMWLAVLDSSIVNTALPRMAADLGGLAHLSWVVTAFMLSSTITTPLYGKFSDTHGRRLMFNIAIGIFLAGSILCGAAQSMAELVAFRALQGFGAGGLIVMAQSTIGDVVAPRDRPRYQGYFSGTFGLASVSGPLLGGILTQMLSWRWIFYVNIPVGTLALVMIWLNMPGHRRHPDKMPGHIDYAGALLLAGFTTALMISLASGGSQFPWGSTQAFALSGLALLLLGLFIWREGHASEPIVRLELFRNKVFARGCAVSGMVMFAMMGSLVFMPLYFQLVLGISPIKSGAMILPQVGCMLLSSIIGGRIVARIGEYQPFLLAGIALEVAGLISLAFLARYDAPVWMFLFALGVLGLGMGMGLPNLTNAIQNSVGRAELGAATGTMLFIRSLGGAIGVAASGAIMNLRLAAGHDESGFHMPTANALHGLAGLGPAQHLAVADAYRAALIGSFLLSCAVIFLAFLLVLGMPAVPLRRHAVEPG